MTPLIDLPTSPVARAALAAVTTSVSTSVAHHSIRSFLFAELLATHEGARDDAAYDRNLLFAACVMHDLGTGATATGAQRFEVEGADLAAELSTRHCVTARDVCLLHRSIGSTRSAVPCEMKTNGRPERGPGTTNPGEKAKMRENRSPLVNPTDSAYEAPSEKPAMARRPGSAEKYSNT